MSFLSNIFQGFVPQNQQPKTITQQEATQSAIDASKSHSDLLNTNITSAAGGSYLYGDWLGNSYLQGADGETYLFVPKDTVNKGVIVDAWWKPNNPKAQVYNQAFLTPSNFDTASQYTYDGTDGFVWKAQDAIDKGIVKKDYWNPQWKAYVIDDNNPAISGIGYPTYAPGEYTKTPSYVAQPKQLTSSSAQQIFIPPTGDRLTGSLSTQYVYGGWLANTIRSLGPAFNVLTPILLDVFVAPGTGSYFAIGQAMGQGAISGDWEKGIVDAAKIYAIQQGSTAAGNYVGSQFSDYGSIAQSIMTNGAANAVQASLLGRDPVKGFVDGGIAGAVSSAARSIEGFSSLPVPVQKMFGAGMAGVLQGKSKDQITDSVMLSAIRSGLESMGNAMDANKYFQEKLGREPTAEELNKFAWYTDRTQMQKSLDNYSSVVKYADKNGISLNDEDVNKILTSADPVKSGTDTINNTVAINKGFENYADMQAAGDDKPADFYAKKEGFSDAIEKAAANAAGFTNPTEYRQDISPLYTSSREVNQMIRDQLGRDATLEEIAKYKGQTSDLESQKKIAEYAAPLKTTEEEVIDFFKTNVGREPTAAEVAKFVGYTPDKTTLTQKNVEDKLINGLDLPEDYKFPDLKTEVKFADAFSAARAAYGPNATFTWTDPKTGVERTYITSTSDEVKKSSAGDYDALTSTYIKGKMLGNIDDPNFNPADLTKSEMSKFIDTFSGATPEQRQRLLTGPDALTFKAINSMLTEALPNVKVTPNTTGTGTLKESDLTNYSGILKAGANTAAADIAGLATRGVQVLGDVFGLDTSTLAKAQDLLTKDKDTMMSKLVGNEKAVAGGLASGIESAVSYTLGGPAAAIGSLTGIAANNAWIEGEKAGLSTMENAQRTAVMATLEAAGEAVGIPGLSRLMKGVPAGATSDQIIAYVKNAGLAMGNEQVSELATTAAQFAVDKWASYGLGKNATFNDFADALKDTAVSTVFAVGSAGSIGSATRALQSANTAPTEVMRTEVTPDVAWKRATDAGLTAQDLSGIKTLVQNSINNGDMTTSEAKQAVIADLQNVGFTDKEATRIANVATADVVEGTVATKLNELKIPADQIDALSGSITDQIMKGEDLKTSVGAVGQQLQKATGMNELDSSLAANKILTGMDVTKEVNDTLSKYNYSATPDEVNKLILGNVASNKSGLASNVVNTKVSDILTSSGLSADVASSLAPTIANSVLTGEGLDTSVKLVADQISKATGQDPLSASIIANEALTGSNLKTQIDEQLKSMNYTPTQQELNDLIGQNLTTQKTDLNTKINEYVDPRYVDQQEALDALNQNLATEITPAQLKMLMGQYNESLLPEKAVASVVAGNIASEQEAEAEKQRKAALAAKVQSSLTPASAASTAAGVKQFGQPNVPNQTPSTSPLAAAGLLAPTFLSSKGVQEKFQGPLEEFQRLQDEPFAGENQYEGIAPNEPNQEQPSMNDAYYSYGQNSSIDDIMSPNNVQNTTNPDWLNAANQGLITQPGGLVANMYAAGGITGTRHGRYAHGGLSTPLMAAGGKLRVDFRHGDAVTGAGDGQSDDIPAMLADGEFVFPADVVAAIGNGSTKAGSDKLYDMMHGIRAHVRSAKPKDLPPEIKSPLDFLKTKPRKARRK